MYPINIAIFFVLALCAQHVNITILVQLNYEVARNLGMPVSGMSHSTNLPPLVPSFTPLIPKVVMKILYFSSSALFRFVVHIMYAAIYTSTQQNGRFGAC